MNKIKIDRRKILKLGLVASAFSFIPFGCIELSDKKLNVLLSFISDAKLPFNEQQTGELTDAEFKTLASLCSYVNQVWELSPDLEQYTKTLESDLKLKTNQTPSYLTEYRNAIQLIDLMVEHKDTNKEAWSTLLFADFDQEEFSGTKIGRARQFVFSEMITHFIPISGGFKTFGLWNYSGYFGGPYLSPESYRKAKNI